MDSTTSRSSALRARLAPYVERGAVPGLVALVLRDGHEQLELMGVKTAGKPGAIERDTLFRISSMTKPITALATMLAIEDGKLRVDEPVERLLPELANRNVLRRLEGALDDVVPAKRAITVRDLLTFQLGFGLILAPPGTYPIQTASEKLALNQQSPPAPSTLPGPDEWLARLGTLPLMHQPGERWLYNTGADVLSVLIARATGKAFDEFLHERVFGPLGMVDTDFHVPAAKLARFTTSYGIDPQTHRPTQYDAIDGQWSRAPAFLSGAGGLVSTVDDFARLSRFMLGSGVVADKRLLSRESLRQMTSDQLSPVVKAGGALTPGFFARHGWGYCMSVVTERDEFDRSAGSYGWDGGLGSSWYVDPSKHLAAILLSNCAFESPEPPALFQEFWRGVNA